MDVPAPPLGTTNFRPRHLLAEVREALADTRVVLIAGARQVGKSTLARMAIEGRSGVTAITLDEEATRSAALADPAGFVETHGLLLIDEVQRVPELFLAIKAAVDRANRPGHFLLTGSANILLLPQVADALPGRMQIVELWPFSQGELSGRIERFLDRCFDGWQGARIETTLGRRDYLELAATGGFPEAVARTDRRRRSVWFESYVQTLLQRDLLNLSAVERIADVSRLLRLLAARSSTVLNIDGLARDAEMPTTTVRRYLTLLQAAYMILLVPAWSNNRTTRAIHAPKVVMGDSGLCAHLVGADADGLASPLGDAGPLLETFVVTELRKQLGWCMDRPRMFHYRTRDGVEVDVVLEAPDGRVVGIEVKAAATVRSADFAGLRHLAGRTGDRFQCGLVLYTGRQSLPFGSKLWCTPVSALWEA
ncbi:MAG TPA: ATP-binding protein [Candidatus Dormibacteraeota bacterium]|nr:ATP-binding protein [Candidatus Dormibacteraeota bacterium]